MKTSVVYIRYVGYKFSKIILNKDLEKISAILMRKDMVIK